MTVNSGASGESGWIQMVLIGRNPKLTLVRMVITGLVLVGMAKFVLLPIRVHGVSMLPTYKENGVNFVNRLAYTFHEPRRGDVVAIRTSGVSIMFLKRIIGLPGETVAFHRGHAVINGQELEERYLKRPWDWEVPPETLGPDEYYCVGDNRSMAPEDHTKGKAHRNRIVGKILL